MHSLPTRTSHYGELALECASTYFKYGCALLYKAQEESDFLGNVPKSMPNEESVKSTASKDDSGTSKISGTSVEDAVSSEKPDAEEGICLPRTSKQSSLNRTLIMCLFLIYYYQTLSLISFPCFFIPAKYSIECSLKLLISSVSPVSLCACKVLVEC